MAPYYAETAGKRVCDALGLSGVRDFSLHFPLYGVAYIKAEILLNQDQAQAVKAVMKEYYLLPKPSDETGGN